MKVKPMPEYECYPTWVENNGFFDNINPKELPISLNLAVDIMEWSKIHEKKLTTKRILLNQDFQTIQRDFFITREYF
ncbi:hypothetical protein [Moraxella marmotae]|uniref:hypothetical protein n=1 Tax=Moraxella marmotae TaxID=3344520 RepID=UPI0035F4AE01